MASSMQRRRRQIRHHLSASDSQNVLLFLIAFRILNALCEWRHQLRSSLHPLLFAAVYATIDAIAQPLHLSPTTRADLLIAAPKTTQAVIAALGDFYTWKLARRLHGSDSYEAWVALVLSVLSPWQWFCSTRTLSNCLETTLTIVALYLWPWQWSAIDHRETAEASRQVDSSDSEEEFIEREQAPVSIANLRQCLLLAAVACVLRPTNILIWITLATVTIARSTPREWKILFREAVLCGSFVLVVSAVSDRLFYGVWTFPPLVFLYFNIAQSLAVFYGRNDWHYYLSQGYPLLLTTALPFALLGLYRAATATSPARASSRGPFVIRRQLALVCIVMPGALSLISHKEVRFIYPLLPSLHILTAPPLVDSFLPAITRSSQAYMPRRLILLFLLLANIVIAGYTTLYHASGPLKVLSYLREQSQIRSVGSARSGARHNGITAGFLMPCHSTPWRSHLVYPSIRTWALSCEPPIGLNETQKAVYIDEADQFYENPDHFLRHHMVGGLRHIPRRPSYNTGSLTSQSLAKGDSHPWPDYLIFFAQMEPTLQGLLRTSSYAECWRSWNTDWHDDWRRRGDIVVWCLDPGAQQDWRTETRRRQLERREQQFDRIVQNFQKHASSRRWSWPWDKKQKSFWWSDDLREFYSSFPGLPDSWPWQTKKKKFSIGGFELPELPSWKLPSFSFSKKKKTNTCPAFDRDLWS